jgi:hypothetical protein
VYEVPDTAGVQCSANPDAETELKWVEVFVLFWSVVVQRVIIDIWFKMKSMQWL